MDPIPEANDDIFDYHEKQGSQMPPTHSSIMAFIRAPQGSMEMVG